MKVDYPQRFVPSTLSLGGGLSAWSRTERSCAGATYNPFFLPIHLVLFLCIIHATLDVRVVSIVTI